MTRRLLILLLVCCPLMARAQAPTPTPHGYIITDVDLQDARPGIWQVRNTSTVWDTVGPPAAQYRLFPFDQSLRHATTYTAWRVLFGYPGASNPIENVGLGVQLYDFTANQPVAEVLCSIESGCCGVGLATCICPDTVRTVPQAQCAGYCCGNTTDSVGNFGQVATSAFDALIGSGTARRLGLRTRGTGTRAVSLYGSDIEVIWNPPTGADVGRNIFTSLDIFGPIAEVTKALTTATSGTTWVENGDVFAATEPGPYGFSLGLAPALSAAFSLVWAPNAAGAVVQLYDMTHAQAVAEVNCSGCVGSTATVCVSDAPCGQPAHEVQVPITAAWNALGVLAADVRFALRTKGSSSTIYRAAVEVVHDL